MAAPYLKVLPKNPKKAKLAKEIAARPKRNPQEKPPVGLRKGKYPKSTIGMLLAQSASSKRKKPSLAKLKFMEDKDDDN